MYRGRLVDPLFISRASVGQDTNSAFPVSCSPPPPPPPPPPPAGAKRNFFLWRFFDLPKLWATTPTIRLAEGRGRKFGVRHQFFASRTWKSAPFDQIPSGVVSTYDQANLACRNSFGPCYLAVAEKQCGGMEQLLAATLQTRHFEEYIAPKGKEIHLTRPKPSMRPRESKTPLSSGGARHYCPTFNTYFSQSAAYHIREAGSTAIQELAVTLLRERKI